MGIQDPKPEEIRKVLVIECGDKSCSNNKCNCLKEGLKSCAECSCKSCNNATSVAEFWDDSDESDQENY